MIPLFKVFIDPNVDKPLLEVLHSGYVGEGKKVVEFEKLISEMLKNPLTLYVNSGTSALHLAYQLCVNGEENEPNHESIILVPSTTCSATITPILANQVKLRWVDVDPLTGNIDTIDLERKICKNTKAVVMVHWGGNPCNIEEVNRIAKKYRIKTIEDAAHSWGTKYKGEYLGNFSNFTEYSLQAIKLCTSVEGGVLCCKSKEDYDKIKLMRWFGIDRYDNRQQKDLRCENDIHYRGSKFQPNDVFATIGIENFKHLNELLLKNQKNAKMYDEMFKNTIIINQPILKDSESSYWLYTIHVSNRDELMEKLKEEGIMTSKVHNNNHYHSVFKEFYSNLPGSDEFYRTHVCIPVGWWVSSDEIQMIGEKILKYGKSI
jgi:dTDP-4-amino-4,6-dideoxygalactose transaminase